MFSDGYNARYLYDGNRYNNYINLESRFWDNVKLNEDSGCWEWQGSLNNKGYGCIYHKRKTILAHRFSFEINNGEFDKNLFICHRCDNPKCVNPDHLFAGTQEDNMKDMWDKNRGYRGGLLGTKNPMSILSEKDVIDIYERLKNKETAVSIAKDYNVSRQTVGDIKNNRRWGWLIEQYEQKQKMV